MREYKIYQINGLSYKVYKNGLIEGKRGVLKQRKNKDGYLEVTMGANPRTTKLVHRVIAELFVPNPNNLPEVNHKDYNRENPDADNLEWISRRDNVRYSNKQGQYSNSKKGFKNGKSIYNKYDILKIRELYDSGNSVRGIIKEIYPGLSYKQRKNKWHAINDICKRISYQEIN